MNQFVANLLRKAPRRRATALPRPMICDWVALDFETANETRGSACAVGVAFFKDGARIGGGESLINPQQPFNPYNSALHGIDAHAVASAPTFPDLWRELAPLLENQTVVAHNLGFDIGVLRATASRYEVRGVALDGFCTYRMAKMTWPGLESYSLGLLALRLGLEEFDHHDAGDDATAAGWLAGLLCAEGGCGLAQVASGLGFGPARITPDSFVGFHLLHGASKPTKQDGNRDADNSHPLYGRTICFTGGLASMPRHEAADRVCDVGADFRNSVGKKLDYLVIGDADFVSFADGWATGKLSRARELIAEGAPIEIIPEREFLELLSA